MMQDRLPVTDTNVRPPAVGPTLTVSDLSVTFMVGGRLIRAVDAVSLRVAPGRSLGIVGESGSGKSVLARTIIGLLPRQNCRVDGSIDLAGRELTSASEAEIREVRGSKIAMIFQDPGLSLNPVMRVWKQIAEAVDGRSGKGRRELKRIVRAMLEDVGIADAADRMGGYPYELSGGMRQRVAIAMALAGSPHLLLADEPTTALDVTVQRQVLDLIEREQSERHMSLMLITHDLAVAAGRTDEIVVMYSGRVVERGETEAVIAAPRHPYTAALLSAVPRLSQRSHTRLMAIPGIANDRSVATQGCSFARRCAFARDRCREEAPALAPLGSTADPDRMVACFYPVDGSPVRVARSGER